MVEMRRKCRSYAAEKPKKIASKTAKKSIDRVSRRG